MKPEQAQVKPIGLCAYDIKITTLGGGSSRQRLGMVLAEHDIVPADQLEHVMNRLPGILAENLDPQTAEDARKIIQGSGGECELQVCQTTCLHCGNTMFCREGVVHEEKGILFACWACTKLTYLDSDTRDFRAGLRCDKCHAVVLVRSKMRSGTFYCSCNNKLTYTKVDPPKPLSKLLSFERKGITVAVGVAIIVAVFFVSWFVINKMSPAPDRVQRAMTRASAGKEEVFSTMPFSAITDRVGVVRFLGPPDREATADDEESTELILYYRKRNICVVLEKQPAGFRYSRTVRLSDDKPIHVAPEPDETRKR